VTVDDKSLQQGHPEAWAPPLLLALIAGRALSDQEKTWVDWSSKSFNTGALLGAGSWNHMQMIAAARCWLGDQVAVQWMLKLLALQVDNAPVSEDSTILTQFGGTETLSSTYEMFRAGSYNALRLLAQRFPQNPAAAEALRLTARYNEVLMALLALGAVPWWDRVGHWGSGRPYYDGPTVSPVGERSTPAHGWQSDLGPFLALAAALPLTTSRREDWSMAVCRNVNSEASGFGIPPASAAMCHALVAAGGPVDGVLTILTGIKLFSKMEWIRWPEGMLVFSGPRLNGNTPKVFWSFADNATQKMDIGFPWQAGFHRGKGASTAAGDSKVETTDGGLTVTATAEAGRDASRKLPGSAPLYHVLGDRDGIRLVPAASPPTPVPSPTLPTPVEGGNPG
jgi:hypothetical protein